MSAEADKMWKWRTKSNLPVQEKKEFIEKMRFDLDIFLQMQK